VHLYILTLGKKQFELTMRTKVLKLTLFFSSFLLCVTVESRPNILRSPLLANQLSQNPAPNSLKDWSKSNKNQGPKVSSGGTRPNEPQTPKSQGSLCRQVRTNSRFTILVPINNPVLTLSEQPTFWSYVPYTPDQVSKAEFVLNSVDDRGSEHLEIYRSSFKLPEQLKESPGIIGIQLPSNPKYHLKSGKSYRWYLRLHCSNNSEQERVNAGIMRVDKTSEREHQIRNITGEIWYDSLTFIASERLKKPNDPSLKNRWDTLLRIINREDLAQEKLMAPIVKLQDESMRN
jgi:Domain of Unknown Function (DUF928)